MSLSLASTRTRASTGMLSLALISSLAVAGMACGSGSPTGTDTGGGNNGGNNGNTAVSVHIVADAASKTTSAYSPNPVTVFLSSGGTVRWSNDDVGGGGGYGAGGGGTTHTVTEDNGLFDVSITPGGSFQRTFSSAGDYSYHCSIHPTMVGTVNVRP